MLVQQMVRLLELLMALETEQLTETRLGQTLVHWMAYL
jgi:hypothetical protein